MQPLFCPYCSMPFFDPSEIWTSPGEFTIRKKGNDAKAVVQCANCKKWIVVLLDEKGNPITEPPDKI